MPRPVLDEPFDAVLFDLDGTLISSIDSVVRSWAQLAAELGVHLERFEEFHGIPARALIDLLLADRPVSERERAFERIVEIEVADVAEIKVLPGAVAALSAAGDRAAIVTSSTRRLAEARIAAARLPAPAVIVPADEVARGKPDPEPWLTAAGRLGVAPARCLVVEDAPAGVAAARAAGAACIAVTTTTPAESLAADLVVADLAALQFRDTSAGVVAQRADG